MRFEKYLNEASYTTEDIPKTFRVVFQIDAYDQSEMMDIVKQLGDMELKGMKGISGSGDIIFDWLGVGRDAMLIMNGPEVIKLNKLSRFMYGNPNYFLSNNMKFAKRLFNKGSFGGDYPVLQTILEYVFKGLTKSGKMDKGLVSYSNLWDKYAYVAYKKNSGINSSKDLVKWLRKAGEILKKENAEAKWSNSQLDIAIDYMSKLSNNDIEKGIYDGFKMIGDVYKSEAEWDIKNESLKVPKNSYLYMLLDKKGYEEAIKLRKDDPTMFNSLGKARRLETIERYENIMKIFNQYKITNKYKVKLLDQREWEKVRRLHYSKS